MTHWNHRQPDVDKVLYVCSSSCGNLAQDLSPCRPLLHSVIPSCNVVSGSDFILHREVGERIEPTIESESNTYTVFVENCGICGPVRMCEKPISPICVCATISRSLGQALSSRLPPSIDADQTYQTKTSTIKEMRTNRRSNTGEKTFDCDDGLCIYEVASEAARFALVVRSEHLLFTPSQRFREQDGDEDRKQVELMN